MRKTALTIACLLSLAFAGAAEAQTLGQNDIMGTWCGNETIYIILPSQLTVVWRADGDSAKFPITGFDYLPDAKIRMNWIDSKQANVQTVFGELAPDRSRMLQYINNRPFRRC